MTRICLFAFVVMSAFAQDYRAKIQGIVTDSSDASVAGAKVTIRNVNTGIAATRETGANGAYLFDNVEPGTYSVSAEFAGLLAAAAGRRPGTDARGRDGELQSEAGRARGNRNSFRPGR